MASDPGSIPSAEGRKMMFFRKQNMDYSPKLLYTVTVWINKRRTLPKDTGLPDQFTTCGLLLLLKPSAPQLIAWCHL